jgi:lipopolysaccharide export system permease protein|tara:strand:- start:791 stop:1879 length:1089 start_codon:yes stop_codon:yes gene_type:complete
MNNVVLKYILNNFLKSFLIVIMIIFCFGVVLNLFEEIEFFKNEDVSVFYPLILTTLFVPSLVIKLLPFIIFISSMWFMLKIRNNNDLLILKIYGFSNIKIFFILATTSFFIGCIILTMISPVTSSMVKYYEITKSQHARDIEHLVAFNKNGLWIKEPTKNGDRIISAASIEGTKLKNAVILELNKDYELEKKIFSKLVDIRSKTWVLYDVSIFKSSNGVFEKTQYVRQEIVSSYNYEKITSLFSNSDTISFYDLIVNYQNLLNNGYSKQFLDQSYHAMLSLPFFLFLMTAIAAILTMHTHKKSDNLKFIIIGLVISLLVYYLKDLSIALGKTDRIPLILSVWAPVIALSFFTFIGVLQINEK